MNLNKFKELLSVPSKTYKESKMVEYLISTIGDMEGVTLICDEHNNIYATKGTLGKGEFYPMFISHTDTVHELVDEIIPLPKQMDSTIENNNDINIHNNINSNNDINTEHITKGGHTDGHDDGHSDMHSILLIILLLIYWPIKR
jgi:hypothetical protein